MTELSYNHGQLWFIREASTTIAQSLTTVPISYLNCLILWSIWFTEIWQGFILNKMYISCALSHLGHFLLDCSADTSIPGVPSSLYVPPPPIYT
jgi:hypothetical protein